MERLGEGEQPDSPVGGPVNVPLDTADAQMLEDAQRHALTFGELAIQGGDDLLQANLRIRELEAENARLRAVKPSYYNAAGEFDPNPAAVRVYEAMFVIGRPLSSGWHDQPDVTAPVRDHAALFRAIRR